MPDVTLTLAAEDQASGILDRIVNSLESLNSAVADQTGVYSEFQQEIIRKQEATNQVIKDRIESEKKVYDSIESILKKTEQAYRNHVSSIKTITDSQSKENLARVKADSDKEIAEVKSRLDALKATRSEISSELNRIQQNIERSTTFEHFDIKGEFKPVDENVLRQSMQERLSLLDKSIQDEENLLKQSAQRKTNIDENASRMAFHSRAIADKATLKQLDALIAKEKEKRKRASDTRVANRNYEHKTAHQAQLTADRIQLKQLDETINKAKEKRKRAADTRTAILTHANRMEYQKQNTHDKKMLKELDETLDKQKEARRQAGRIKLEQVKQENRKELALMRRQEQAINKHRSQGGRGAGSASDVFKGVVYADLFGFGVHEVINLGREVLQATIKIQGMIFGLQAVEGSAEKAAIQLDRIIDIAKLPGIQLEPAIKATVTLRALKLEGELVERTIKAIGNALATLGREGELGGVVLALSQIVGKGKIHAEEINQIAERLPLIRGILVEEFGTANTEVLQKMELEIEDFVERITQGLERLPKVATQIGTSFKNLENQIFLFTAQIGTYFKNELMGGIDLGVKILEHFNKDLKAINKQHEEMSKRQKSIEETRGYAAQINRASGTSPELMAASQLLSQLHDLTDREIHDERTRESVSGYRQKHGITEQPGMADIWAGVFHGSEWSKIQLQAQAFEKNKQQALKSIPKAQEEYDKLLKSRKESMDELNKTSYEQLKQQTLKIDARAREIRRLLTPQYAETQKQKELQDLKLPSRVDIERLIDVSPEEFRKHFESRKVLGEVDFLKVADILEKYDVSEQSRKVLQQELDMLKRALTTLGKIAPDIIRKHREQLKESSEKSAKAAAVELEIYNDKIAELVATEIVPELDPSLEQKIKRVAESADVAVGIEAKVLGLQEQFNAAVGVGLDGLLRAVDDQLERDMRKIANNIKPIAEKLKPEIAALKTKAEREAEYDKVLADIRTQMDTVAELHKQAITEYYNSMVALEVTFKKWLSDSGGGTQIPTQLITRIDKLAESQMIQDAIGLQMQGLEEPFNRVREYALDTLTKTIQGDTENQLIKLREDVLKIAKATHPDFHTYTPERQTEIFGELFEQRAPAIRASEKALLDVTADRFNAILDIHLEFQRWYEDTVGKDTIAPELEGMVRQVTQRSDFGEAVRFRVEGFETEFQSERGRMIQGMIDRLQKDTQKALQSAAGQAHDALVAHEDYLKMTPEQRTSEWNRIYNQLKAPIQTGMGVNVKNAIEHFDKVIEVQTVYNEWIRNTSQTPIISDTDMSRLNRAIASDDVQMGIEFELAGMTTTFKDVKGYALKSLVDSINEEAQRRIANEAKNVSAILLADPATLEMSRSEIQSEIKKIHDKRIDVINLGRDLAIQNVEAEFENLSRQETIFRRWLSQNTGQTKMQREISEDVQKVIRGGDVQKAFEPESRFEIMSRDADEIINKGLQDIFKQIDRDSQIDLEKRMEGAGGAVRAKFGAGGELEGMFDGDFGGVFMRSQLDQFKSEQEAIVNTQNELRKTQAEKIYNDEINREKEAHRERQNVKRDNDRIDVLEDNRIREQLRRAEVTAQQSVEDSALSAANNVISAWQQVSQQTDTMVDDVVGAVATIALQVTEMLLTIQRTSAASTAAGQTTGLLGQFATGLGVAGIALGAAATVYSLVDQQNDSRGSRNSIQRGRPKSISRR